MSFWPFPRTLLAELQVAYALGPLVEIGAGAGHLAARLDRLELPTIALDLRHAALRGVDRAVTGDATALPFARASLGGCLFADVLRHLNSAMRARAALECARCLRPGGRVVVIEDVPWSRDEAERNYRRILALLARSDPARGPACDLDEVTRELRAGLGPSTVWGEADNEERAIDPQAPLRWMRARSAVSGDPELVADLDRLEGSIRAHGLRYGRFAFAVFVSSHPVHTP